MLKIVASPTLIGMNSTDGKFNISQPQADVKMHTEHVRAEIESEQVQVQIDQYQPFAEAGLKNFLDLTKEYANKGKQTALEGIARRVRQGEELSNIQTGINPIPSQAVQNAFHMFDKEFAFGAIPKSRPEIDFIGGTANINFHQGKTEINVKPNNPTINYTMGKTEAYLKQKNSINIEYVGNQIDKLI